MKEKFKIKVIAKAKNSQIRKSDGDIAYLVKVKSPREKGRANKEVINLFSEFFEIKKSRIIIVSGEKSSIKTIQII